VDRQSHYPNASVFMSPLSDFLARARDQGLAGVWPITHGDTLPLPLCAGARQEAPGVPCRKACVAPGSEVRQLGRRHR
jgi:hypothetical protein